MGKREGESEKEGNHVARTDQWPVIAVAMQRERERRESGGGRAGECQKEEEL